jgi:Head fiber protein.
MKIENAIYRPVDMRWESFNFPIKAGTPVSKAGVGVNDGTAIGIIPQNVAAPSPTGFLLVLVGGSMDLQEVETSYGDTISAAALQAMSNINFTGADWTRTPDPLYSVPTASSSDLGGVKIGNGINISSGKISVKAKTNGGIAVDSNGVSVAAATATALGGVKMAEGISDASEEVTVADFNGLLAVLRAAGILGEAPLPPS